MALTSLHSGTAEGSSSMISGVSSASMISGGLARERFDLVQSGDIGPDGGGLSGFGKALTTTKDAAWICTRHE